MKSDSQIFVATRLCGVIALLIVSGETKAADLNLDAADLALAGKEYIEWDHFEQWGIEHRRANEFHYWVMGAVQALAVDGRLCFGIVKNTSQLSTMVARYMNDHPERWQASPSSLVIEALEPTFACKLNKEDRPAAAAKRGKNRTELKDPNN